MCMCVYQERHKSCWFVWSRSITTDQKHFVFIIHVGSDILNIFICDDCLYRLPYQWSHNIISIKSMSKTTLYQQMYIHVKCFRKVTSLSGLSVRWLSRWDILKLLYWPLNRIMLQTCRREQKFYRSEILKRVMDIRTWNNLLEFNISDNPDFDVIQLKQRDLNLSIS